MLNVEEKTEAKAKTANPRAHWPEALQREFEENEHSGVVGTTLVSETDSMRIWHLLVPVGGRCGFHRHVNDYFWTAHTPGKARSYYNDGRVKEATYYVGETQHFHFGPGEYFAHNLENIGDTDLLFTTVEFLNGANKPLPVPDDVRLKRPA